MDSAGTIARFESTLAESLALAGSDAAVEAAARILKTHLASAARQLVLDLAEQASAEVAAQLPEHDVDVVLQQGQPVLSLRPHEQPIREADTDGNAARLTLRLPSTLKEQVDEAARGAGISVNAWVVDALTRAVRRSSRRRPGMRVRGTIQT
jgi:hypothetical protein